VSGPVATPAPDSYQGAVGPGVTAHHRASAFRAAAHALIVVALMLAGNAFACKPAPWGTGSYPVTSTNAGEPHADGEWAYWFCQDAFKTTWQMRLRKTGAPIVIPSLKDKTPTEAFAAIEAANITLSLDDPSLAGLKEAALTHLDSRIPPDPTWAVAKNSTTLTRPVYARNEDGTLGALDKSVRATVGAECQCADPLQRVVSGASVYCAFRVEAPLRVTLCKPVP
jgi:hypothetical protein